MYLPMHYANTHTIRAHLCVFPTYVHLKERRKERCVIFFINIKYKLLLLCCVFYLKNK
jgi:hypothetical protein